MTKRGNSSSTTTTRRARKATRCSQTMKS